VKKSTKMKGEQQMKNEMTVFEYGNRDIRTIDRDGETWFVAKDVCDVLEISNSRDAVSTLDSDDLTSEIPTAGGQRREMTLVNEPGLYSLIFKSRTEASLAFKRWVTHDVLPKLRKTGSYSVVPPVQGVSQRPAYWTAAAFVEARGLPIVPNVLGKSAAQYCRAMGYLAGRLGASIALYPENVLEAVAPRQILINDHSKYFASQII
jgi:prophage antirepressor-like protein